MPDKPSSLYRATKRLLDIIGSLIGLIVFALAYIPIAIAIKREDGGPVLVALSRMSSGKVIKLYKFRSMIPDAARLKKGLLYRNERSDGPFFKITDDPRLTRIGKTIRKWRLDELPQFINVFKGEISLVGPRPHEQAEVQQYPKEFVALTKAKTGMTGLSQISGASGLPFLKELELDRAYLQAQSLTQDFYILGKTVWIMLFDHTAV